MDTKTTIDKDGIIIESIMGGLFRIEFEDGKTAIASVSSNIRRGRIKLFPGDKVKVEFSPYDETRGRIVYKYK
ncbi:MAG: translation initiation factor IF-1 [Proteobacteria bacterium]|nr:translation initiation factor IF-1 [Pseudomonadota bacterium]